MKKIKLLLLWWYVGPLCLFVITIIMAAVLCICAIAPVIGILSGLAVGMLTGIKNYFAALFTQVKLRQR